MIGVVFPSWRIPEHRLQDHFAWNASFYLASGAKVFVVTDREHEVPGYAQCVIFSEEKLPVIAGRRRFATTRCRNVGIRAAIAAGCDPIICTEVDIAFQREAWKAMVAVTFQLEPTACVPYCRMSLSSEWERREDKWLCAPEATGTVTMAAENWGYVSYSEEQWGYGCDDGLMVTRIEARGIKVVRTGYIYHMAHVDGAEQKEFHGRCDHWNRASGFNPENFNHNLQFR